MHRSKNHKVFYGYWIVVVAFLCLFIWAGCGYYSFSLFVKSLEADFGWVRGEIMAGFTIIFVILGIASPFVGKVVDRYGVRGVITTGSLLTGLGFALLSLVNNLWAFYLCYVIVGAGMAAIGTIPTSTAVSNWFERRRGLAIGIMSTGIGVGGFVITPIVGSYLIPHFGWRASYLSLALLTWVLIIPLALLVIRTKPAEMGLYPDGIEAPDTVATSEVLLPAIQGFTLKAALATPALWLIGISFLLGLISINGVILHQVPHLEDIGFPVTMAATALGTVAFVSIIGRLGFGWLCDRVSAKYAWSIGLGLQLVGIVIFMNVQPGTPLTVIWIYTIFMGLSAGAWLPTMSIMVSSNFGLASYGAIFGVVRLFQSIGIATGPIVAGYIHDAMNTYHWVFIIFLALCVIAIPTILAVRRPKSP